MAIGAVEAPREDGKTATGWRDELRPARRSLAHAMFPLLAIATLVPIVSPGLALLLGIAAALMLENPYPMTAARFVTPMLQVSVVGLGAGMNLAEVASAGVHGFAYTVVGISLTMTAGLLIGRLLETEPSTSMLVTVGTAICGGSAIAAVAPVIRARSHEVSVALATVFFLNSVALFIFPWFGHHFALTQAQFGVWSALAIHDTSSVVGAAMQYGARALEIATTIKLTRALWIVPLTLTIGVLWNRNSRESNRAKARRPWFILGFVAAAALVTWLPILKPTGHLVFVAAQRSLVVTLFLIGSGLNRSAMRTVGRAPLLQGFLLWLLMATVTLGTILTGWIR